MPFSHFVGNQSVIALAKAEFASAKVTIVVGRVRGGRTTFVRCLEQQFADAFRFERYDCDDGVDALRTSICNADARKPGAMEAWISGRDDALVAPGLKVVLDDFDPTERGICAMLEGVATTLRGANGIVIVTDGGGLRKLSSMKKRGALVLALANPGREAVLRWARKALLPDCPEEADLDRLRAMMKACDNSIARLEVAYATGASPETAAMDSPDKVGEDNATMMHRIFGKGVTVDELMRMVEDDGGTMLGQLVVHNAPSTGMEDDAYVAALSASLDGMVLERSGHVRHEKLACTAGHVLSISPFLRASDRVDKAGFSYTSSMAQGGARAAARRAMSKADLIDLTDASVAEKAFCECGDL